MGVVFDFLYYSNKDADGDSMSLVETINGLLANAGLDLGGVVLVVAVVGSLLFFTQNHRFGLVMLLFLLLISFFVQKNMGVQTAMTLLLMLVVIVFMAITLYLSEKNSASYV